MLTSIISSVDRTVIADGDHTLAIDDRNRIEIIEEHNFSIRRLQRRLELAAPSHKPREEHHSNPQSKLAPIAHYTLPVRDAPDPKPENPNGELSKS
jgi:hypothetical protein